MKRLTCWIIILLSLVSCEESTDNAILYLATGASSPYTITFWNEAGNLITETVQASSTEDQWNYAFPTKKGEIIYLSAHYSDITSGVNLAILINGKVYKQVASLHDTTGHVIVSGTVPY